MAEAYLKQFAGNIYNAFSAGLEPGKLNPIVVKAMKLDEIDISRNSTKSVNEFIDGQIKFDYVITVCDETSAERCPYFPGQGKRLHWGFNDPSSIEGDYKTKLNQTIKIRNQIKKRIKKFLEETMINNNSIENVLKSMNFDFFGKGKHKIKAEIILNNKTAVFLDVRSKEEYETVAFNLKHNMQVLHIPTEEIPDRLNEIPKEKLTGIFCSSSVRASMVYLYLRALGYENVKIIQGGYDSVIEELKPGKLYKIIN